MDRKEFYNSLSEDLKARIKACKSEEEMLRVLSEEKIELDPDVLEKFSGGVIKDDGCVKHKCGSVLLC